MESFLDRLLADGAAVTQQTAEATATVKPPEGQQERSGPAPGWVCTPWTSPTT